MIARSLDWVCKWERIARACGGARRWLSSSPPWREAEERGGRQGGRQRGRKLPFPFLFLLLFNYLICFPSFIIQQVSLATHLLDLFNNNTYTPPI